MMNRWCPTKQIVTKHLGEISSQPCVGQTLQKWRRGAMMMMMTMTPTFLMKQFRPQMIVTTMSLDPNIQILPLVILLGHESQGFHNHRHLAFYNTYT
jgi:hypothetical protein